MNPDDFLLEKVTKTLHTENGDIESVYLKEGDLDTDEYALEVYESLTVGNDRLYSKYITAKDELVSVSYLYETATEKTVTYGYDGYRNLIKAQTASGGAADLTEDYRYDWSNALTGKIISGIVSQKYTYSYENTSAHGLKSITFNDVVKFKPLTDVNGRNTGREILNGSVKTSGEYITYRKVGDHATNMPATVRYGNGAKINDSIKYRYGNCGNISEISENGHTTARYTYDKLNRLTREDNKPMNKTVVYAYDNNGNITERCEYAYTTQSDLSGKDCTHYDYTYDGDRLINFNGEECAYNNLGNPTIYRGKQVLWQYGERLTQIGDTFFVYDGLGRRTRKRGTYFVYDNENRLIYQSNGLEFIYDTSGVAGIKYKDNIYCYRKDVQGNIIAVLDNSGNVVVKYNYDAWGRHTITDGEGNPVMDAEHIAYLNPFRYRGYYYDTETRLYYLNTRYYDPEVGRFISQDDIDYADPESINGLNLYAYCGNNPVMNVDPTGTSFLIGLLIGLIVVSFAATGATIAGVEAAKNGATGWELVGQIFLGAAFGVAAAGVVLMFAAGGMAIAGASILGFTAQHIFAIGAALFNVLPMVVAPIAGITAPAPIEYNPNPYVPVTPMPPYTTMSMSVNKNLNVENILKAINLKGLNYDKISRRAFARM